MMLVRRFPMLLRQSRRALLVLGTWALTGCDPGSPVAESPQAAAAARALVRPLVARNALTAADPRGASSTSPTSVQPGPTAVVLGHRAADGTLRVGCVDSEDGAEALVRAQDDQR